LQNFWACPRWQPGSSSATIANQIIQTYFYDFVSQVVALSGILHVQLKLFRRLTRVVQRYYVGMVRNTRMEWKLRLRKNPRFLCR
jgi:hypothetical protein